MNRPIERGDRLLGARAGHDAAGRRRGADRREHRLGERAEGGRDRERDGPRPSRSGPGERRASPLGAAVLADVDALDDRRARSRA